TTCAASSTAWSRAPPHATGSAPRSTTEPRATRSCKHSLLVVTTGTAPRLVDSAGVRLAVREAGPADAPVVLLIHGYPDTSGVWDEVAALLADRLRVVRYDVRGMGASTKPSGRRPYALEHLVTDMVAVIDATAGGRPIHLVGHDW